MTRPAEARRAAAPAGTIPSGVEWLAALSFGAAAAVLAVAAFLAGAGPVALLGALALAVLALPPGLVLGVRVLGAILLAGAATTAWVLVVPLLGLRLFPAGWLAVVAGLSAAVVASRGPRRSLGRLGATDVLSIGLLALGAAFGLWQYFSADAAGHLAVLVTGEDNASHLSLIEGIRLGGRYLYWPNRVQRDLVYSGLQAYPQGSHAIAAVVLGVLQRGHPTGVARVALQYSATVSTATALFAVAAGEAAAALARRLGARGLSTVPALLAPFTVVLAGPLGELVSTGYFAQAVAYVGLLALLALVLDPAADGRPWLQLAAAGAGVVAASACWYFLLPVSGVAAAGVLWRHRAVAAARPARTVGCVLAVACASAPHVLVSLAAGAAGSLNAPGGVIPLSPLVLGAGLLACAGVSRYARRRDGLGPVLPWLLAWVAAAVFGGLVGVYQQITAGHTSYYYDKALYTVLLTGTLGAGAGWSVLTRRYAPTGAPRGAVALAAAALGVAGLAGTAATVPRLHPVLVRQVAAAPRTDPFWTALLARFPIQQRAPVIVWRLHHTLLRDYLDSRLIGAVYHQDTSQRWAAVYTSLVGREYPRHLLILLRTEPRLYLVTGYFDVWRQLSVSHVPGALQQRVAVLRFPAQ